MTQKGAFLNPAPRPVLLSGMSEILKTEDVTGDLLSYNTVQAT